MGDMDGLSRGFTTSFDNVHSPIPVEFSLHLDQLFLLADPTIDCNTVNHFDSLTSILPLLANIIQLPTTHNH